MKSENGKGERGNQKKKEKFQDRYQPIEMRKDNDITERKREKERLQAITENAQELILIHDMKGTISFVNQATIELTGYEKEKLIGSNIMDYFPKVQQEDVKKRRKKRLQGDDSVESFITLFKNDKGEILYFEVRSVLISINGKNEVLAIARNITQQKKLQKLREVMLMQLNASIGYFWNFVDQIRNPLNVLWAMLELNNKELAAELEPNFDEIIAILNKFECEWLNAEKIAKEINELTL